MDGSFRDGFFPDHLMLPAGTDDAQRTRPRDSLFMLAQLRFDGERTVRDVRMRNLSAGGLMVDCPQVREPGTPVALSVKGLGDLAGKVAWCTEGRIGIALDTPIDPRKARQPVGGHKG